MGTLEISCVEIWREISNYIDADVSPELRERMEAHLRTCAHCSAVLDGMQNIVGLIGDGKLFQMPEGFNKRLYDKIRGVS
jgi:anti-sigma factor RsiW